MDKPADVETLRAHWTRRERRLSADATELWPSWVVVSRADGAIVGELDAAVDMRWVCVNFGYFFFPFYWGQGFATEAVCATTHHLLQQGVTRLVATVTPGNVASARVLQKSGFVFTRVLPANDMLRGTLVDDDEFVLTDGRSRNRQPTT